MSDKEYKAIETNINSANIPANLTLSGTAKWNDKVNSNPIEDIRSAIKTMLERGIRPTNIMMSQDVYDVLSAHPSILGGESVDPEKPYEIFLTSVERSFGMPITIHDIGTTVLLYHPFYDDTFSGEITSTYSRYAIFNAIEESYVLVYLDTHTNALVHKDLTYPRDIPCHDDHGKHLYTIYFTMPANDNLIPIYSALEGEQMRIKVKKYDK